MAMTPEDMAAMDAYFKQKYSNGQQPLPGATGMQGFGDIKSSPEANQAAQDLAGTTDDALGGAMMMDKGTNLAAAGGGVMSPFEAIANGAKTALGGALIAKNMKSKQNAIKSLLRKPESSAVADAELLGGMGLGGGQGSVQGNSDYVTDI